MMNFVPAAGSEQHTIKKAKGHMLSDKKKTKY